MLHDSTRFCDSTLELGTIKFKIMISEVRMRVLICRTKCKLELLIDNFQSIDPFWVFSMYRTVSRLCAKLIVNFFMVL